MKDQMKDQIKNGFLLFAKLQVNIFLAQLLMAPIGIIIGFLFDEVSETVMLGVAAYLCKFALCWVLFYNIFINDRQASFVALRKSLIITLLLHLLLEFLFYFQPIVSGTDISKFAQLWARYTVPEYQRSWDYKDIPLYIFLVLSIADFLCIISSAWLSGIVSKKKIDQERMEILGTNVDDF